jgi:Ca2+-binding RTX toxin-like protein
MPRSGITTLTPKGKEGKTVTFAEIKADGLVAGTFFAETDTFASYSYGLKGKLKDLTIYGTDANEYLVTGDGNDTIDMVGGDNIVVAGGGNDFITTTSGSNYIDGGDGIDSYIMNSGYDGDVDLSSGTATKTGLGESDTLFNIENVFGNDGDNVITGDDGANYLSTGDGTDTVYGGGGADTIDAYTQTGSKTFVGGTGDDTIFAGADADEF